MKTPLLKTLSMEEMGTQFTEPVDTETREIAGRIVSAVKTRGEEAVPVPLEEIVGKRKTVPLDHPWIRTARSIGTALGD